MKLNWQNLTHFPRNSNKKSVLTFCAEFIFVLSVNITEPFLYTGNRVPYYSCILSQLKLLHSTVWRSYNICKFSVPFYSHNNVNLITVYQRDVPHSGCSACFPVDKWGLIPLWSDNLHNPFLFDNPKSNVFNHETLLAISWSKIFLIPKELKP